MEVSAPCQALTKDIDLYLGEIHQTLSENYTLKKVRITLRTLKVMCVPLSGFKVRQGF